MSANTDPPSVGPSHGPAPETRVSRRGLLSAGALAGGAMVLTRSAIAQQGEARGAAGPGQPSSSSSPPRDYTPVVVPNGWTLPYKMIDGVKVFHLVAEEVDHEFAAGLRARCWSYNGGVHGPVIEAVEGDRVRIFVTNRLPAPTTVHWHGLIVPSGMDGVGGLSQKAILPGETYVYEFTLVQHGTLMYHSHHDEMTQMALGLTGLLVIHPRAESGPRPDRDFAILLHEWKINVGAARPDPGEMSDFNILTMNGKVFPATQPLIVKRGDRVRIRLGNLGAMNHHPIHLHGYTFTITDTDGGEIPESARIPATTVLVAVGTTRTIEFTANNPGDWVFHCHMSHHVMNQMGHGLPNMIGVDPEGLDQKMRSYLPEYMTMGHTGMSGMTEMGMKVPPNSIPMVGGIGPKDEITMGGMFTILKVRESLADYDQDPGWYEDPQGTQAAPASAQDLSASGIDANGATAPRAPKKATEPWKLAEPRRGSSLPSTSPAHGHAHDHRP